MGSSCDLRGGWCIASLPRDLYLQCINWLSPAVGITCQRQQWTGRMTLYWLLASEASVPYTWETYNGRRNVCVVENGSSHGRREQREEKGLGTRCDLQRYKPQ